MAFYVRKIARAKWRLLEKGAVDSIENYVADTIANDLRTCGNTLSLWRVESLSQEDIKPAVVINCLLGDTISPKIDLIFIPEKYISNYSIEQSDGDTVVSQYRNLHYNITQLTVKSHLLFAKDVILAILASEERRENAQDNPPLIQRFTDKEQLKLIEEWIKAGIINFSELKPKQKERIEKYYDQK